MARSKTTLSANDLIVGTPGDDELHGTDGDDQILGGDGDDLLSGEAGNDVLDGQGDDDELFGGSGDDTLFGDSGTDVLKGESGNDILNGGGGDDILDGGTSGDSMAGGTGDDLYIVEELDDTITEFNGGGYDRVESSVDWTLGDYVEELRLTGVADVAGNGNSRSNNIFGNVGSNLISGMGNDDALMGFEGNDTLEGGSGKDYIEGGVGSDVLYGGSDKDRLYAGGDGDAVPGDYDMLYGGGGNDDLHAINLGAGHMEGGTGNDRYYISSTGYTVVEGFNEGIDKIFVSASWTLGDNFENLEMYHNHDDVLQRGLGNDLANDIKFSQHSATIYTNVELLGFKGDDTLSYFGSFPAGADIFMDGGGGNDTIAGHNGNDTMVGGTGNDVLMRSGRGVDVMTGGNGNDDFQFFTFGSTVTITDFHGTQDQLSISEITELDLELGQVAASAFRIGSAATKAEHRLIYDANAGRLFYDADGNGAGEQVLLMNIAVTAGTFNHQDVTII
jgi:Ca2+-binding RTX toxin-like protein